MKMKSHSGASKRFHRTGTGKFMRKQGREAAYSDQQERGSETTAERTVVVDATKTAGAQSLIAVYI